MTPETHPYTLRATRGDGKMQEYRFRSAEAASAAAFKLFALCQELNVSGEIRVTRGDEVQIALDYFTLEFEVKR